MNSYFEYKGLFVCQFGNHKTGFYYRVKESMNDSYSLHHGSFLTPKKAKAFIDSRNK